MVKKVILLIGILLLLGTGFMGWRIFQDRHDKKALTIPSSATQTSTNKSVTPSFNKTKYSIDSADSIWVVANKARPLSPLKYSPGDLVSVGNNQQMRKEPATAFAQLIAAAKSSGLTIKPLSGFRSYNTQDSVYKKEVATYGQAKADTQSAKPGYSEHQTGLAIDVGGGGCGIEDCFGNTAEGKWLAANAYSYGFIVRYQAGKENVTGYRAEPWHIRYVGTELSVEMHNTGIQTLEEFFGL